MPSSFLHALLTQGTGEDVEEVGADAGEPSASDGDEDASAGVGGFLLSRDPS